MKPNIYVCSLVLLVAGSCAIAPKSESVAQGDGDSRTGTSEVATLRADKAELAAAKVTAERDAKAALALVESMTAEVTALKSTATAGRDLQLDAAIARLEASFSKVETAIQGAVGVMTAAGDINNKNLTINGMNGWQQICLIVVLFVAHFIASKLWNTRQIEKHEERAAEKVAQAVASVTR